MTKEIEEIFDKLENNDSQEAIKIIKEELGKRNQDFIEDFIQSLSIITEMDRSVVKEIMPKLLSLLDIDDDVIRYSMIATLKEYVPKYKDLIFPYVKDFLKYGTPKKREGMIILLKYVAEDTPKTLQPYYDPIVYLLGDPNDFVRKNVINVLQYLGKVDKEMIELKILGFLKEVAQKNLESLTENIDLIEEANRIRKLKDIGEYTPSDHVLMKVADVSVSKSNKEKIDEVIMREAANDVLKEIVSVDHIEKEELEKRELEAKSKVLEKELKNDDEEIRLKKLKLEKEQKELEQRKIQQELEKVEKEKELIDKQKELEMVKRELELKRLESEKSEILNKEKEILEERLKKLESGSKKDEEDYDEIQL